MDYNIYFDKDGTYVGAIKATSELDPGCYTYKVTQSNFEHAPGIFEYFYNIETGKISLISGEEHNRIRKETKDKDVDNNVPKI
jgi:hypothetical protein